MGCWFGWGVIADLCLSCFGALDSGGFVLFGWFDYVSGWVWGSLFWMA